MKNTTSHVTSSVPARSQQGWSFRCTPGEFSRSLHEQHRSLAQGRVLGFIRRRIPRQWVLTEVVGSWVWVHATCGVTEQERSMLFELGFHWSPRRQAWQHPCGVLSAPGREPFARYFPAEQQSRSPKFAPHV